MAHLVAESNTQLFSYSSGSQKSKTKMLRGPSSFWMLIGESIVLPFFVSMDHLHSLAHGHSSNHSNLLFPSSQLLLTDPPAPPPYPYEDPFDHIWPFQIIQNNTPI